MASNPRPVFKHPRVQQVIDDEPKRITAGELTNAVTPDNGYTKMQWNGLPVLVRRMIPFDAVPIFIDEVLRYCVAQGGTAPEFPEYMDYGFRSCVIGFYTNVDLPDDFGERYMIVYGTDLYDIVCGKINHDQLAALKEAIETYIKK